ncbi:hypothetical protein [Psychrobacter faecalis]|uniref:hypothetical protein n=1 Tax=Psychrobacter faecalis TaxID=180588 RepID=UPI0028A8B9E8|nr:hypothetical protein [Psychrobacter faecalis]
MGLDITAYKNVKLVENPKMGDTNHPEVWGNQVYINIGNSEWGQGDDLESGQVYGFSYVMSVYRSSYSTYGNLRNELARIAGYEPLIAGSQYRGIYAARVCDNWEQGKRGILSELICFADNEGEIGTKTCRKILNDLHTVSARAGELNEWNQGLLTDLIQTFEFAAVDGFIQFH